MKEMSKDKKIELLERFLKAVIGRPQSDIEIKYEEYDAINLFIIVSDCDIDDVVRVSSNLDMYDISTTFHPHGQVTKGWDGKSRIEGTTEVEFFFEPLYYERVEELEKKVKELEKKEK